MSETTLEALAERIRELEQENRLLTQSTNQLQGLERYLLEIFDNTPAPIYMKDSEGRYVLINKRFEMLAHTSLKEIIGKKDENVFPEDIATIFCVQDEEVKLRNRSLEFEETLCLPDGKFTFITVKFPLHDVNGKILGVAGFCTDITERKKAEDELFYAASHDSLTGLFNRQAFKNLLINEMERAKRYDTSFSLIILDIDNFKSINDTFGHQAGDRVLVNIAELLRQNVRTVDCVGRWGGEEFLILLSETRGNEAALVAEKLRNALVSHKFDEAVITASFGVTIYQRDDTPDIIIKRVDELLYRAKDRGKNRVEA